MCPHLRQLLVVPVAAPTEWPMLLVYDARTEDLCYTHVALFTQLGQKDCGCVEEEGEGGFIAREGIEQSQSRQPERCIPCHADVLGGLVVIRHVAAPAAKAKFDRIGLS